MEDNNMQEYKPFKEGKVREVYDNGDSLIMVATDRISAFDNILKNKITDKGAISNVSFVDILPEVAGQATRKTEPSAELSSLKDSRNQTSFLSLYILQVPRQR
mgnify:CR=1 FL=1